MRVAVPILDVRSTPVAPSTALLHDEAEETQLLYGEQVLLLESHNGWGQIEAVEQFEWSHHERWEGYPGWVDLRGLVPADPNWYPDFVVTSKRGTVCLNPADLPMLTLSLGTCLMGLMAVGNWWNVRLVDGREGWICTAEIAPLKALRATSAVQRQQILSAARSLLGDPYYWGGRSAHLSEGWQPPQTGVDCSGLVNLCYRSAGLLIPRDAHEQCLRAKSIARWQLQPGDLVFLADAEDATRVTHVMLYAGQGRVIEGPGTGSTVREISLDEKLKTPGIAGRRVAYGTYLP